MTQYTLPLQNKSQYRIDDFIFSNCNRELQDLLDNASIRWGHPPYQGAVLLSGSTKSGKTHFAHILQSRYPDLIIRDNIETNFTEEELLHQFNSCHEAGQKLLFISNGANDFKLADFKSRIASIRIVHILLPDDQMVELLLTKALTERSIKVKEEVIKFLLARIPRSYKAIDKAVEIIDSLSMQQKRNITVHFLSSLDIEKLL